MDAKKYSLYGEEEIKSLLRTLMKQSRYEHSLNVAERAAFLAEKYGADPDKARFAGLVHDICKGMTGEEQLAIIKRGGIELDEDAMKSPALWHSAAGTVYIREKLGVTDGDIINAVRYHTTGRAGMSILEKTVYIADLTSADRSYPDAEYVRRLSELDIDQCIAFSCRWIISDVTSRGLPARHGTEALAEEYKNVKVKYTKADFEKGETVNGI